MDVRPEDRIGWRFGEPGGLPRAGLSVGNVRQTITVTLILEALLERIAGVERRHGPLLARYVAKYF